MVRPSIVLTLAAMLSATLVASSHLQQTTQQPPPAKPPAKPTTPPARPTTPAGSKSAPAKPGTTAAPAAGKPAPAPAPAPPPKPATDVRMKTSYAQGAQVSQNMTYLQGPRQRVEFPGVVSLDQCDLKRSVMLNTSAKRYRVQPYAESAAPTAAPAADPDTAQMAGMPQKGQRGGVVTITTTLTDTLERQQMFGLEARRVKTTVVKQAAANACDKSGVKIEMDTWYVDLPQQSMCVRPPAAAPPPPVGGCSDTIETRTAGDVKLGFPVRMTTTTTIGDGDKAVVSTSTQEVTELEITRLDRTLFDVPSDYVEANSTAEIVPAIASGGGLADALFGSTADGTSAAAPKKAGTIRIGILEPVNKTTRELSPNAMRQDLVSKFNKAPYEALPVAGSSAAAIEQEAARLDCDYLLLAEITEAKTSKPGKLSGVMSKAGGGPAKDAHEVKLDYKLFAVGATGTPKLSGNAKGSNGGFGVGSALRLAAFAGQMYLTMMSGGGMMNGMMGMSGLGGGGMSPVYDPRASAMSSLATSLGAGMSGMGNMSGMGGDPSEAEMRETVSEALGNAAKATMEQLNRKK
jgi:hypothetical protein